MNRQHVKSIVPNMMSPMMRPRSMIIVLQPPFPYVDTIFRYLGKMTSQCLQYLAISTIRDSTALGPKSIFTDIVGFLQFEHRGRIFCQGVVLGSK